MRSVVPSTLIAHSSLTNGSLHLRRQVLRRLYDVINVLEAIHLLDRCLTIKRGVLWRGPPLTEVSLPPGCPRVEPQRFKDLLRKQPIRKRAAAELLAVSGLSASSFNKHARLDVTGDGAGAVASAERGGRGAIPGAPGAGALPGAPPAAARAQHGAQPAQLGAQLGAWAVVCAAAHRAIWSACMLTGGRRRALMVLGRLAARL